MSSISMIFLPQEVAVGKTKIDIRPCLSLGKSHSNQDPPGQ